jgi:hypothetical protein
MGVIQTKPARNAIPQGFVSTLLGVAAESTTCDRQGLNQGTDEDASAKVRKIVDSTNLQQFNRDLVLKCLEYQGLWRAAENALKKRKNVFPFCSKS